VNKKNTGVQEFRSSGVQEFRILLNQRTCLEIGATSQAFQRLQSPTREELQWLKNRGGVRIPISRAF
jgi:hypothetical protein